MVRPLPSSPASAPSTAVRPTTGTRRIIGGATSDRVDARPTRRRARGRAGRIAGVASLLLLGAGCAHRDRETLSAERVDRDRVAREAVLEAIERDHAALTALIASDRFDQPKAIYSNPELRALALHLMEQTRRLRNLADTDVLAPGQP